MTVRFVLVAVFLSVALSLPRAAEAAGPGNEAVFDQGVSALKKGAHDEAIDQFELLADRGVTHADASYNRGLAYAQRAKSTGARPGDLGQAAAAFEETLALRSNDPEAPHALMLVRDELARSRGRRSAINVAAEQPFPQAIVSLIPESIWALIALLGSLTLAVGLLARRFTSAEAGRLTAATASWVGAVVFVIAVAAALLAAHDRERFYPAVTIAKDVKLLDELGRPQKANPPQPRSLNEGIRVDVAEQRGRLTRVRWGDAKGWVLSSQLRPLAQPQQ